MVTVGLVIAGGVMIATGVGAPIGVGLIAGATLSTGAQIAMTGEVDGRTTLISTIGGGLSGGAGGMFSSAPLATRIGAGALTDGAISAGSQYALTGQVSATGVMVDSLIGGGGGIAGARADVWAFRREAARAEQLSRSVDFVPNAEVIARRQAMLDTGTGYNVSPIATFAAYDQIGRSGTFVTDARAISDGLGAPVTGNRELAVGLFSGPEKINYLQLRQLERGLGLNPGSLVEGGGFRITEVNGIDELNPRVPSSGNDFFRGVDQGLPNGGPELMVDAVPTAGWSPS